MTQCACSALPDVIPEKAVADVPELHGLIEVSTDYRQWVTKYVCPICRQEWEERYVAHGQSNVPSLHKRVQ